MERISVPFFYSYMSSDLSSFTRVSGLLRVEGDTLVLEFRQKTTDYSGMTAKASVAPLRTLHVPLHDIESISLGWRVPWGSRLVLTVHTLAALEGLPDREGPAAALRIPWQHYERARALANTASLHLIDRRLRELGEGDLV